MSELKRDSILKRRDLNYTLAEIPEWGGSVRVYELTIKQKLEIESRYVLENGTIDYKNSGFQFVLVSACVRDSEDDVVFGEKDKNSFYSMAHTSITRLVVACVRYNWNPDLLKATEKNL